MRAHGFFTRAHTERGCFGVVARLGGGAYLALHSAESFPAALAVVSRWPGVFDTRHTNPLATFAPLLVDRGAHPFLFCDHLRRLG